MTVEEFMDDAADHGVTFKVTGDAKGFNFAVGWPHDMRATKRVELQAWVDANSDALAEKLLSMCVELREGGNGVSVITPETRH